MRFLPAVLFVAVLASAAATSHHFSAAAKMPMLKQQYQQQQQLDEDERGHLSMMRRPFSYRYLPTRQSKRSKELVDIEVPAVVSKRSVRRYCGELLFSTLQLACRKQGRGKRDVDLVNNGNGRIVGVEEGGEHFPPMMWRTEADLEAEKEEDRKQLILGMLQVFRKTMGVTTSASPVAPTLATSGTAAGSPVRAVPQKRGVTDACCLEACSWATLVSFC